MNGAESLPTARPGIAGRVLASTAFVTASQAACSVLLPVLTFQATGSAQSMALLRMAEFAPAILFGAVLGGQVDRRGGATVSASAMAVQAVAMAAIGYLAIVQSKSLIALALLCFVMFTASNAFFLGSSKVIRCELNRESATKVFSLSQTIFLMAEFLIPVCIGVSLATVGSGNFFLIGSALLGVGVVVVWSLAARDSKTAENPGSSGLSTALLYIRQDKSLLRLLAQLSGYNCVIATGKTTLVVYGGIVLKLGPGGTASALSLAGLGALIGTLAASAVVQRLSMAEISRLAMLCSSLSYLSLLIYPSFATYLIVIFLEGLSSVVSGVAFRSFRQVHIPAAIFGRVNGACATILKLLIPISLPLSGFIIDRGGVNMMLSIAALLMGAMFLISFVFDSKGRR